MKIRIMAFIFIFICISSTACGSIEIGPKKQVTSYLEKQYNLQKALELSLKSDSSNIEIYSWGKKYIKFEITKMIRGIGTTDELNKKLENYKVSTRQDNSKIYFESKYKGGIKNPADKSVDLKIYIPKKMKSIEIKLDMGKLNFYDDVNCDLNIQMNMANVDINKFEGKINLKGDMGDLRIGEGRLTGESNVSINMGNISIKASYEVNGVSAFKTNLGNIDLKFPEDSKISAEVFGNIKENEFPNLEYPSKIKVDSEMGRINIMKY